VSEPTLDLSNEISVDELLTVDEAQKLAAQHGEVAAVKTKCGVAAFRSPTDAEYGRYNALLFDEKTRANAFKALVKTCVVKPSRETFEGWVAKSPGIVQTCLNAVLELAGVDTDAQTKKY
jgi:hypothetical protein